MAIPLALMAAGTVTQMLGTYAANIQQAIKEQQNAAFYREQAVFAKEAALRAERLAGFEYATKFGQQVGAYAASGVDMSGSAALTVGGTIANALSEIDAIRKKGALDFKLAYMRGAQSDETANTLNSPGYNLMQGAGTLIGNYTRSEGFGSWNADRPGLTDKYVGFGAGLNNPGGTSTSTSTSTSYLFGTSGGYKYGSD